jgi:hypothetical protein
MQNNADTGGRMQIIVLVRRMTSPYCVFSAMPYSRHIGNDLISHIPKCLH